jgi:hypothetical protein
MKKLFLILVVFILFNCTVDEEQPYYRVFQFVVIGNADIKHLDAKYNYNRTINLIVTDPQIIILRGEGETGNLTGSLENQGPDGDMRLYIYNNNAQIFYDEAVFPDTLIEFDIGF